MDPVDLAIRKISETRELLALLVTSSESFDYLKAKTAIADLQLKVRELGKLQGKLEGMRTLPAENIIRFEAEREV